MRGATTPTSGTARPPTYFNPRTPCGVRQLWQHLLAGDVISIHAPHAGCDDVLEDWSADGWAFQSTHPMRGATARPFLQLRGRSYFNPRTPCGVRRTTVVVFFAYWNFNPRTPCGVRLIDSVERRYSPSFQSTHPMRGATKRAGICGPLHHISIHAPHAGCDTGTMIANITHEVFQSTHPMRGATTCWRTGAPTAGHFNPRTPCGVRRHSDRRLAESDPISIHAPHAGCDCVARCPFLHPDCISIHAPHAGCDLVISGAQLQRRISIHAPHAGCDSSAGAAATALKSAISIHAPHAGCDDSGSVHFYGHSTYFNPRTPCGVRQYGKNLSILPQVSASFPRSGKSALYLSGI